MELIPRTTLAVMQTSNLRRRIVLIGDGYRDYAASCANSLESVALVMRAAEPNGKAEPQAA